MKKIFAILIIMVMALSLCGCSALEAEVTSNTPQVHITVGKVEPGMTVKDVFVEVTDGAVKLHGSGNHTIKIYRKDSVETREIAFSTTTILPLEL